MLPGGRAVLFTITALKGGLDAAQVVVQDLQTGARRVLARGGSHAHYVPSGHLVYAAAGTLLGVAFDLARLETRGTPVPVIPDVMTTLHGGVHAVMAGDGSLVHVSGGVAGLSARSCGWTGRAARRRSRRRRAPMSIRACRLTARAPQWSQSIKRWTCGC